MTDKPMKNGRKYMDSGFVHDTMDNVNDEHYRKMVSIDSVQVFSCLKSRKAYR